MSDCNSTCQYHQQLRSEINRAKEDHCALKKSTKDDNKQIKTEVTNMLNTRFAILLTIFLTAAGFGGKWLLAMADTLSDHKENSTRIHSENAHTAKINARAIHGIETALPKILEKLDAIHSEQIESRVEMQQIKRDIERYHGSE